MGLAAINKDKGRINGDGVQKDCSLLEFKTTIHLQYPIRFMTHFLPHSHYFSYHSSIARLSYLLTSSANVSQIGLSILHTNPVLQSNPSLSI